MIKNILGGDTEIVNYDTHHVHITSVADLELGSSAFLTPGSGIRNGRKSGSGSGIGNEHHRSIFRELRNISLG
jgi:hypothetical protein